MKLLNISDPALSDGSSVTKICRLDDERGARGVGQEHDGELPMMGIENGAGTAFGPDETSRLVGVFDGVPESD